MKPLKVIIYGTKVLGQEIYRQIECYNRIVRSKCHLGGGIEVLAFTESIYKGGYIEQIPILPLEQCAQLPYDYIIVANAHYEEIKKNVIASGLLDVRKIVRHFEWSPEKNGLNLSQLNTLYYYHCALPGEDNEELALLYQKFDDQHYFTDIENRRRFVENKNELERWRNTEILYDTEENLNYVFVEGKRLYYPKDWSHAKITEYHALNMYTCMSKSSAHCYLSDSFDVNENDIVADIGAAEGLFSLYIVDRVKKIYLFEVDETWLAPLYATFKPYRAKVVIENKFITNIDQWEFATCDKYFRDKEVNLVKMDIEGEEQKALLGCRELLKRKNIRWLITTYHRSLVWDTNYT